MSTDLKKLAATWAAAQEVEGERSEAQNAPIFAVHALLGDPEKLWQFILAAEPICTSESAFGMLGTGPLEDLIQEYGVAFLDRIEYQAKQNPRFAKLFAHVWVPAGQDPVTLRYLALGCTAVGPPA